MIRPLQFLRILDEQSNLSITNLSILGLLFKILAEPNPPAADVVCLAVAVINYVAKKVLAHFQSKIQKPSYDLDTMSKQLETLTAQMEEQKNKISSLSLNASIRPPMKPLGSR